MKKLVFCVVAIYIVLSATAMAEPLDEVWIIKENTGSPETMEKHSSPNLSPNQTIEVYIEEKGLSAKWGEGFVYYTYTYYSDEGKKIWTSKEHIKKKRTSKDTWTFSHVHRINIPENIPNGTYRIGFELTDYHSKKVYHGNVHFTVGKGAGEQKEAKKSEPTPSSGEGDYRTTIGEIELELVSVEKSDNRLTFKFKGINNGDAKNELRLYPYQTSIISKQGVEFTFSEYGGGGSLASGTNFPPEVAIKADFYFKRPVPARVSHISYLEIPFYSTEDKVIWKDIPVPWPEKN